jgi:cytochrome b
MALFGTGPLGLQRFYPHFRDLKLGTLATHPAISRLLLGIAVCLLGVTTTGVLMDQGRTLQRLSAGTITLSTGDHDEGRGEARGEREGENEDGDGLLSEVHELFANLLIGIVVLHVGYLVLFKWPLARFMLFFRQKRGTLAAKPAP